MKKQKRSCVGRRSRRGQSLVEFALVIPVFLMVFFGVIDLGRLVYLSSVVSQAAREGARLAAVEASWVGSSHASCGTVGGPVCPANIDSMKDDVVQAANRMVAPFGSIAKGSTWISCDETSPPTGRWNTDTCVAGSNNKSQWFVSVRVEAPFTPLTPIIGRLIPPVTASGSATMVIN